MIKRMGKGVLLIIAGLLLAYEGAAQGVAFDPVLDPACEILSGKQLEEWGSSFMWYPGQLSAHAQKQLRQESKERCTYVGYPGKFNPPVYQSYFRKSVKLSEPVSVRWAGPSTVACYVNGRKQAVSSSRYTLEPGHTTLLFEVTSADRLPCLLIDSEEKSLLGGWEVSLDNINWNSPESYPMYNKPGRLPDDRQEKVVEIPPFEYIPLVNAREEGETLALGKNGCAIIDFRHLEVGTVRMDVTGRGTLRFRVGETPEEALNEKEKDFEQHPLPPYELTGSSQQITLPERALRYLNVVSNGECVIRSVKLEAVLWPVNYLMQFECSDEKLNDLWNAGSATLHTSMHQFYLDGIKRDYLPWSMDAIESALAGDYLFGDEQVSRNGLSIALTPPDPQVSDLGIVDYPLHALIGFKHDYLRYGKLETSLLYKDRIIQMLALYESIQDENGFISAKHSTSGFIPGWATKLGPDGGGIAAYGQIMLYHNYVLGAYFARLWKENNLAGRYEKRAASLKKSIMEHFWEPEKKAFINGYLASGEKDNRISHHAQYWAILADLFPTAYYDHLFEQILPDLSFYKEYISYEKGYEFLAYIKAGRLKEAVAFMHDVWGDWLNQGHSRFPENFSPYASRGEQLVFYDRPFGLSLCHGGNGVAPVLIALNGILGFRQSDKQISEYTLEPDLLDLDWAKGRIPVKEGFIYVSIDKEGTAIVKIPEKCVVHIRARDRAKPLRTMKKAGTYECTLR